MKGKDVNEIIEEAVRSGKVKIVSSVSVGDVTAAPGSAEVTEEDLVKKPKKYRNQPTMWQDADGTMVRFDSKRECAEWIQLKVREKAGDVTELKRQVPYELKVGEKVIGRLILDMVYFDRHLGEMVYADVKSPATITQLFKWKRKHFEAQFGLKITLIM